MTVWFDEDRGRWRFDFQLAGIRYARECIGPDGQPVTSKRAAQDCEDEARRQAKMGPKLPRAVDLTLAMAVNAIAEGWTGKPDEGNKLRYARELLAYFKPEKLVREISAADCQDYIVHLTKQPVMIWVGGSKRKRTEAGADSFWKPHKKGKLRGPATVNRHLPVLRAVFRRAYDTRDPITNERAIEEIDIPEIIDLKEPKRIARPVPDDVLTDVRETVPEHISEAIATTLYFGFRRDEVFTRQIHHVDFQRQGVLLDAEDVKNNEDALQPGSRNAMQFMAMLVDQAKERGTTYLFTWRRKYKDPERQAAAKWMPVKSPKRAWKTVMKRIEKKYGKRWRWHDVRAAYITEVAIGSGGIVAQKLARHADFSTTQAYIAVADDVTRAAAEKASQRPALNVVSGGKK